jgi:hypothetical protein
MAAALKHTFEAFEQDSGDDSDDDSPSASGQPTEVERRLGLPFVPGIEKVPRRLLAADEIDLRWFLDDPRLSGIRGSSDFGAQLARAESYGYGALPCRACGGTWSRRFISKKTGLEVVTGWRDGTGYCPKKRRGKGGKQESYSEALARYRHEQRQKLKIVIVSKHPDDPATRAAVYEAFKRRGERVMTEAELRELFPTLPHPGDPDCAEWTAPCPACKGIGVVERRVSRHAEVTVWPTGSSKRPGAREPVGADELVARAAVKGTAVWDGYSGVSLTELERFLAVELVLRDVAALSVAARVVLEEYYGPAQKRRHGQPRGLLLKGNLVGGLKVTTRDLGFQALWPLTTVGAKAELTDAEKSQRAAEVAALYAHGCGCFNLAAYGGAS